MATTDLLAPTLHTALADELRRIGALLEQLAETLAGDAVVAARHLDQLQNFDLLIQCTDESASVLDRMAQGAAPQDAIAPVRLTAVQDRLRAALEQAG